MGENGKENGNYSNGLYRDYRVYGWLSKLWPFFGYPKYQVPYHNRTQKGTRFLTTTHMTLTQSLFLGWGLQNLLINN